MSKRPSLLAHGSRNPDLTWRLLAGAVGHYDRAWGHQGREWFRDGFSRLYLIEAGRVIVNTAERTHSLTPGRLWLIPADVSAQYRTEGPLDLDWLHFNLFLLPELDLFAGGEVASVASGPEDVRNFREMVAALRGSDPCGVVRATGHAASFLAPLAGSSWQDAHSDHTALRRIRPLLDLIASRLAGDCSVPVLAEYLGYHPIYFSRLFKKAVGMPPGEYVLAARMRRAATQLVATSRPVKQIGAACGFPDPYHFSRTFKRRIGVSPSVYRERTI